VNLVPRIPANISPSNGNSLELEEMNESILNHLFLPHYLPSPAADDFLIQDNHQNEYKILECMEEYLNSFESTDATISLPIFRLLTDCIQHWSVLQNPQNISVSNLF